MDGVAPWQEATAESLFLQGSDPIPMCHSEQGLLIHRDSDASNYPGNPAFSGQTLGNFFIWCGAGGRMWDGRFGNTLNEWRDGQMSRSKDTSASLKMKNQTSKQAIGMVAAALKG